MGVWGGVRSLYVRVFLREIRFDRITHTNPGPGMDEGVNNNARLFAGVLALSGTRPGFARKSEPEINAAREGDFPRTRFVRITLLCVSSIDGLGLVRGCVV